MRKNPKQEYKREAFELFSGLLNTIKSEVTKVTMLVQIKTREDVDAVEPPEPVENVQYQHADYNEPSADADSDEANQPVVREGVKIGRNDPCPCGSGKNTNNAMVR